VAELDEDVVARLYLIDERLPAPLGDEGAGAASVHREVVHAHSLLVEVLLQLLAPARLGPLRGELWCHRRVAGEEDGDGLALRQCGGRRQKDGE
jgi:hypothetical protein